VYVLPDDSDTFAGADRCRSATYDDVIRIPPVDVQARPSQAPPTLDIGAKYGFGRQPDLRECI
jgi:hypothetical protein